ncbi:MAG: hypothetical protein R2736_12820 [Solirubrobacterales bacterium]
MTAVRDLLQNLVGALPAGCDHAEARIVQRDSEAIGVRNGAVEWMEADACRGSACGCSPAAHGASPPPGRS